MLFERVEMEVPEGLETPDTIVSVKSGMNHRLKIPVISNSKHDIFNNEYNHTKTSADFTH